MASQFLRVPVPARGIDVAAAPNDLDPTRARVLQNLLVDHANKARLRGGLIGPHGNSQQPDISTVGLPTSTWFADQKVLVAGLDRSSPLSAYWTLLDAYGSTFPPAITASGTLREVDLATATATTYAAPVDLVPGPCFASVGTATYGPALDGVTTGTYHGHTVVMRKLLKWVPGSAPTALTGAPLSGQDVAAYAERLFVLGGQDVAGGGTAIEENTLFWSNPGGPVLNTAADWQDPVSGLSNKLVVESDDKTDVCVGLAKIASGLAIFKRRSIHLLTGTGSSSFAVKQMASGIGCLDVRGILPYDDGVFFVSQRGLSYFDGVTVRHVADQVFPLMPPDLKSRVSGSPIAISDIGNRHIMLMMGTLVNGVTPFYGLMHVDSGAWSTLSLPGSLSYFSLGCGGGSQWLVDKDCLSDTSFIADPDSGQLVDSYLGVNTGITGTWKTGVLRGTTPLRRANFARIETTYDWQASSGADDADDAWTVSIEGNDGTSILPGLTTKSRGNPSTYLLQRRAVAEMFQQADDFQVTITGTADTGTATAWIGDTWLEVTPTAEPRVKG